MRSTQLIKTDGSSAAPQQYKIYLRDEAEDEELAESVLAYVTSGDAIESTTHYVTNLKIEGQYYCVVTGKG